MVKLLYQLDGFLTLGTVLSLFLSFLIPKLGIPLFILLLIPFVIVKFVKGFFEKML